MQSGDWEEAIESLKSFWIDKKNGQVSIPPQEEIEKVPGWIDWQDASNKNAAGVASEEDCQEGTILQSIFLRMVFQICILLRTEQRLDFKFFDNKDPFILPWFIHSAKPLQDSIEHYANFQ